MPRQPASIIAIIIQKPFSDSIKGMPFIVFMPKIAARRVSGNTITENIVKVFIIHSLNTPAPALNGAGLGVRMGYRPLG